MSTLLHLGWAKDYYKVKFVLPLPASIMPVDFYYPVDFSILLPFFVHLPRKGTLSFLWIRFYFYRNEITLPSKRETGSIIYSILYLLLIFESPIFSVTSSLLKLEAHRFLQVKLFSNSITRNSLIHVKIYCATASCWFVFNWVFFRFENWVKGMLDYSFHFSWKMSKIPYHIFPWSSFVLIALIFWRNQFRVSTCFNLISPNSKEFNCFPCKWIKSNALWS